MTAAVDNRGRGRQPSWTDLRPIDVDGIQPPHDDRAERLAIEAAIVVPGFVERVSPPLEATHFWSGQRAAVWGAILEEQSSAGQVDAVSVLERLRASGAPPTESLETRLEFAESEVTQAVSAARLVYELGQQRALALHCQQAVAEIYARQIESTKSFYESFEARSVELCRTALRSNGPVSAGEAVTSVLHEIFDQNSDVGVSSGFEAYDQVLGPLRAGEFTIVGGSTGNGKTAWGLTLAGNVAIRGEPVLYVATADMKARDLSMRLLCSWAAVSAKRARMKLLSAADFARLTRAAQMFKGLPLHFDEAHDQTVQEIDAATRRMSLACERTGKRLRLVVVDYIQRCRYLGTGRNESEEATLRKVAGHLKVLAAKHKVHVLGLAQSWPPKPAGKEGGDGKPDVDNLKGCKSMANEAENVAFIHRTKVEGKYPARGPADLVVRKCRWGGAQDVPLIFDGVCTRFEADPDRSVVEE